MLNCLLLGTAHKNCATLVSPIYVTKNCSNIFDLSPTPITYCLLSALLESLSVLSVLSVEFLSRGSCQISYKWSVWKISMQIIIILRIVIILVTSVLTEKWSKLDGLTWPGLQVQVFGNCIIEPISRGSSPKPPPGSQHNTKISSSSLGVHQLHGIANIPWLEMLHSPSKMQHLSFVESIYSYGKEK